MYRDAAVVKGGAIRYLPSPPFPAYGLDYTMPSDEPVDFQKVNWMAEHSQLLFAHIRPEDRWC